MSRPAPLVRDGYSLVEVVAALLIIGLAMAGLFEGAALLSRMQRPTVGRIAAAREVRAAETAMARTIAAGRVYTNEAAGDPRQLTLPCEGGECAVRLAGSPATPRLVVQRGKVAQTYHLPAAESLTLVYDSDAGRYDHWPPADEAAPLRGVSVIARGAQGDFPILSVSSWIEQPKSCAYDMVIRACRPAATR